MTASFRRVGKSWYITRRGLVAHQDLCAAKSMRQRAGNKIKHNAPMINHLLEFCRGLLALPKAKVGYSAYVHRIKIRQKCAPSRGPT